MVMGIALVLGDCDDFDGSVSGLQGGGCPMGASCLDILADHMMLEMMYTRSILQAEVFPRHTMCIAT